MALQPGTTLGLYEILSLIGAGGMGEVYRARDPRLNREVAIKVLPADRVGDEDRRRRFVQEAHAASALNHPHIITIHQIESADGIDFIVMEYVRGKSVDALIPRHGMRLVEVLRIATPVADALAAAHARGIIHRDLKPANVMVGTDGAVKVLDFGLAKLIGREDAGEAELTHTADVALSEPGTIAGTAAYMAPEQASGGHVDARSDIFSFGAMLYEMVTGVRAFAGTSMANTLAAILRAQPKRPTAIVPGVPVDLEKVILRCLRKDPERRFQHMADVRVALQEIKEDSESASGLPGAPSAHPRRARLVAALAGTTLLIAAGAGLGFWLGGRRAATLPDHSVARLTLKLEGQGADGLRLTVHNFFVPLALSPDGTRLVFRAIGPKGPQLFLRELAGVEAKALPGTEAATTPFFSPDGRWVAFWTAEDRTLQKVSVSGGPPIEIAPTNAPITALWGANDEIVIETGAPGTLWSIPADGGTPRAIVVQDRSEEEMISLRARIPGRRDLLVASIRPGEAWLEVLSRDTGRRRRLLRGGGSVGAVYAARTGHLVYADADTLFAVPVDSSRFEPVGAPAPAIHGIDHFLWHTNVALAENGTIVYLPAERVREAELVWRDRAGNVTPVPGGRGPFVTAALSPDGREAVGEIVEGTKSQVWIVDVERGAKRLLVSEGENRSPIWSRDGAFVTYGSNRGGKEALYRRRADGTGSEERLVGSRLGWPSPEEWSPDGRSLLFTGQTGRGDIDIWIYSSGTSAPLIASPFNETSPRFSPDGRFVAFQADDGGVSHVYVQPFPGPGPRTTVSIQEGWSPRWGSGGRRLFYDNRGRMMVAAVQTAPVLRVGQPELLSGQDIPSRGLAVTIDGPRFLEVSRRAPVAGPLELHVVVNWFEDLERIAPHQRR